MRTIFIIGIIAAGIMACSTPQKAKLSQYNTDDRIQVKIS